MLGRNIVKSAPAVAQCQCRTAMAKRFPDTIMEPTQSSLGLAVKEVVAIRKSIRETAEILNSGNRSLRAALTNLPIAPVSALQLLNSVRPETLLL